MSSTPKKESFSNLLEELNDNHLDIDPEYKYIGTGNPNSDILFIGKEAAISVESEQYKKEILDNLNYWTNLQNFDIDGMGDRDFNEYSPLYPYKGQFLKKDNGKNWGTSTTWMNYQKLINKIFNKPHNEIINFHEKAFITEVNSTPSKQTVYADVESISFRKKHILSSDFIQNFPIVIISGVGYFEASSQLNEVEHIFKVNFTEKKFADNENKKQPYWVHRNVEKTKIVINTYQLSIGISDQLLDAIAMEIQNLMLLK